MMIDHFEFIVDIAFYYLYLMHALYNASVLVLYRSGADEDQ